METKAHHILVGVSALVFIGAIVGVLVWLIGLGLGEPQSRYRVDFDETVSGLQEGSPVRVSGVDVGSVEDISLIAETAGRVQVIISMRADLVLREGATAQLKRRGITGAKFLAVSGGDPDAPSLDAPEGELPRLEPRPSPLTAAIEEVPGMVAELRGVTRQLGDALGEEDARLNRVLANLETASAEAPEAIAAIETAARDASTLMERSQPVVAEGEQTLETARRMIQETQRAATALSSAADQLEGLTRENREPIRRFTSEGLSEVRHLINESRIMVEEITRLADRLENDPRTILFGPPGGTFEPEEPGGIFEPEEGP